MPKSKRSTVNIARSYSTKKKSPSLHNSYRTKKFLTKSRKLNLSVMRTQTQKKSIRVFLRASQTVLLNQTNRRSPGMSR